MAEFYLPVFEAMIKYSHVFFVVLYFLCVLFSQQRECFDIMHGSLSLFVHPVWVSCGLSP